MDGIVRCSAQLPAQPYRMMGQPSSDQHPTSTSVCRRLHLSFGTRPTASRDLREVLSSDYGLSEELKGWTNLLATDISGDGQRIVGRQSMIEEIPKLWIAILDASSVAGDFDLDGELDANDMDLLSREIALSGEGSSFDLNDDGLVNPVDRSVWIENHFGSFFGDANLDKQVTFADFLALSDNFSESGGGLKATSTAMV